MDEKEIIEEFKKQGGRNLKFRARDNKLKKFVYFDAMKTDYQASDVHDFWSNAQIGDGIQQFTGLLDCDEEEIYDGDIIRCVTKNLTAIHGHRFVVYFVKNMSGFAKWDLDSKRPIPEYLGFSNYHEQLYDYKIVGSIFEKREE